MGLNFFDCVGVPPPTAGEVTSKYFPRSVAGDTDVEDGETSSSARLFSRACLDDSAKSSDRVGSRTSDFWRDSKAASLCRADSSFTTKDSFLRDIFLSGAESLDWDRSNRGTCVRLSLNDLLCCPCLGTCASSASLRGGRFSVILEFCCSSLYKSLPLALREI